MQPGTQEPPANHGTNVSNLPTAGPKPLTTTDTEAGSISSAMQPGTREPPANVTTHGTDVSNKAQVHSSWSRFSRKVRDIITGTKLHDKGARKKAKKIQKQQEKAQKQHDKLQAQRAESLRQLAQSGWNVKDVHGTEKGN